MTAHVAKDLHKHVGRSVDDARLPAKRRVARDEPDHLDDRRDRIDPTGNVGRCSDGVQGRHPRTLGRELW